MRNLKHRARRKQTCEATGKRKYLTREDAAHDMGLLARTTTHGPGISAYKCGSCGEHHVGHMPKQIKERFGLAFHPALNS